MLEGRDDDEMEDENIEDKIQNVDSMFESTNEGSSIFLVNICRLLLSSL